MNNLKYLIVIPMCLLAACATQGTNMEPQQPTRIAKSTPLRTYSNENPRPFTDKNTVAGKRAFLERKTENLSKTKPSRNSENLDNNITALGANTTALGQHKERTTAISSWEISGAMAAKNKSKGWNAAMNWRQEGPNSYHIRLMGPLGAGTVLIDKRNGLVTFQDGPKKITSSNADMLLAQQTGIRLPVSNLYYWMRGIPAPGKFSAEHRDAAHHLTQLRQSGYTITFGNYTSVQGIALPSIIRLEGNGVMVKVVIKRWNV